MAWMSKTLTLELLAIIGGAIDAAYNRILQEPSPLEPGTPEPTQEHQDCVPTITKHHNPQPITPAEPAPEAPSAPTQGNPQTPQYDEETLEKMLNEAKKNTPRHQPQRWVPPMDHTNPLPPLRLAIPQ